MAFWRRSPKFVSREPIDLNELPPGLVVIVRTASASHWLTTTRGMRLTKAADNSEYVTGVVTHASDGFGLRLRPEIATTDRHLLVGNYLRLGMDRHLRPVSPTTISSIRTYELKGVKPDRVGGGWWPGDGVDLAHEAPGTVVTLMTYNADPIHLTLARPVTVDEQNLRGVFVTRKSGDIPLVTPYACIANRRISPGSQVCIFEDGKEHPLIREPVVTVLVDGVARTR